jgi:O-antigen ligase
LQQTFGSPIGGGAFPGFRPVGLVAVPAWESALVIIAAIMYGTNFTEIFLSMALGGAGHSALVWSAFFAMYAAFGLLLLRFKGAILALLTSVPLLLLLLAFPFISILWSGAPEETFERAITLLGSSLFGLYLGWRFTLGRIIVLLATAFSVIVCLNMALILLVPSLGIDQTGQWSGAWLGFHIHKNGLGASSALACLTIGYAITDSRGRQRLMFCGALLLAVVLLIGSRSTTSLLAVLAISMVATWARYVQVLPKQLPILSLIVIIGIVVAGLEIIGSDQIEGLLAFFGKDTHLSSRVPLWGIVWSYIQDHFWLGYGYEAFWQPGARPIRLIEARLYFTPFYSHNGLLETWLNGGLVLVSLFFLQLCGVLVRAAIIFVRWREVTISSFPFFFSTYFILVNFSESSILGRNSLTWALFVMNVIFLTKWVRMRVF